MYFFLIILFSNFLLYIFNENIARALNLFDNPDQYRKLHKNKVPLTGGIIIFFNSLIAILFILLDSLSNNGVFVFKNNLDLYFLFFSILIFFLVGFLDDKYNISATKRLLFISIILFPIVYFSDDLMIKQINFSFIDDIFILPPLISICWTVLCFLLFINAMNMFDGINYQVGFYSIYLSIFFLINEYFEILFIFILIGLITFMFLNHKQKSFLGDSGTYLLAFIFSYFFIKLYNQTSTIQVDKIVLFMIIPGIDLIRLFTLRIIRGRNPFSPDRNHLHHIINSRYSLLETNLIIQLLIILPSALGYYFGLTYIFLLIQLSVYTYIVFIFK